MHHHRLQSTVATLALASSLAAQIPVDSAFLLEQTPVVAPAYFRLVDTLGRGTTQVRRQSVFMPIESVALDRTDPTFFYYLGGANSFAGTWQAELWPAAEIGANLWGPWSRVAAVRIAVGDNEVLTGEGADLELFDKVGNAGTQILTLPIQSIVDIAALGGFAYVADSGVNGTGSILEVDLATSAVRTVGVYGGLLSLDVSPFGQELLIGTNGGDVLRIDIVTGATTGTVVNGLGPVTTVGYTRLGTAVYSDGVALWSEIAGPQPIYISPSSILDFGVALATSASIVPFGEGCGAAQGATISAPGLQPLPELGNATFAVGLENAPPSALALLVAGNSRSVWANGILPFDLAPLGATGCNLLTSPDATALTTTDAAGSAQVTLAIPNNPALLNAEFAAQWFVPDATIGTLGLAASEGASFVIG
ncbi:MAG: hypothetical protein AB8H80_17300 [Planctomycetota bacterium]